MAVREYIDKTLKRPMFSDQETGTTGQGANNEGIMEGFDPQVPEEQQQQVMQAVEQAKGEQQQELDTAQDPESFINAIRGDQKPLQERYRELGEIVGEEDAFATPVSSLIITQPTIEEYKSKEGIGLMESVQSEPRMQMGQGDQQLAMAQIPGGGIGNMPEEAVPGYNQGGIVSLARGGDPSGPYMTPGLSEYQNLFPDLSLEDTLAGSPELGGEVGRRVGPYKKMMPDPNKFGAQMTALAGLKGVGTMFGAPQQIGTAQGMPLFETGTEKMMRGVKEFAGDLMTTVPKKVALEQKITDAIMTGAEADVQAVKKSERDWALSQAQANKFQNIQETGPGITRPVAAIINDMTGKAYVVEEYDAAGNPTKVRPAKANFYTVPDEAAEGLYGTNLMSKPWLMKEVNSIMNYEGSKATLEHILKTWTYDRQTLGVGGIKGWIGSRLGGMGEIPALFGNDMKQGVLTPDIFRDKLVKAGIRKMLVGKEEIDTESLSNEQAQKLITGLKGYSSGMQEAAKIGLETFQGDQSAGQFKNLDTGIEYDQRPDEDHVYSMGSKVTDEATGKNLGKFTIRMKMQDGSVKEVDLGKEKEVTLRNLKNPHWWEQTFNVSQTVARNKVREQFLAYGVARALKPTGRLNIDDLARASKVIDLYGLKDSAYAAAKLDETWHLIDLAQRNKMSYLGYQGPIFAGKTIFQIINARAVAIRKGGYGKDPQEIDPETGKPYGMVPYGPDPVPDFYLGAAEAKQKEEQAKIGWGYGEKKEQSDQIDDLIDDALGKAQ